MMSDLSGEPHDAASGGQAGQLNRIDRAAVFLMLLGDEEASSILARMSPAELEKVGAAMMALGDIDQSRMSEALADFVDEAKREVLPQRGRPERMASLLDRALGPDRATGIMKRIEPQARPRSIEIARWLSPGVLVRLIEDEHPQVIAALLLLIEPDAAAAVLAALPPETQSFVVERVAKSGPIAPAAIDTIDKLLNDRVTEAFGAEAVSLGGPREAAMLINAAGNLRQSVLPAIAERDAPLAERIEDELFTFEMLLELDAKSMGRLLRDVNPEQLVDALMGLKEDRREPFFAAMSARAADGLREEMESRHRVAKSDVLIAQRAMVEIARGLAEAGEIAIGNQGDEYV